MTVQKKAALVWEQLEIFNEQFEVLPENNDVQSLWQDLSKLYQIKGNEVYDCYIVATMKANSVSNLLTNNPKDFDVYSNIINIFKLREK